MVLNIAEGRGSNAGNARARFSTACGSAKEVRAALNVASDWGYIESMTAARLDEKLDRGLRDHLVPWAQTLAAGEPP